MYDNTVTQRMIEASAEAINADARAHGRPEWIPTYSDIPTVQAVSGHLNDLWDWERKQLRRPLKQDEVDWIRNERRLCALDFNYWCNTTDAPIWMADLSFKPIGEIKVGDKVMGWEKADRPKLAKQFVRDHYTPATVLAVMRRKAPVIEVTMASGRVVKCTPDHLWSNGNSGRQWTGKYTSLKSGETKIYPKKLWTQAKVGATLRFAIDPIDPEALTNEQRYYAGWLGGIIDGEGSIGASGFRIAQYQKANPEVHAKIAEALDALHFEYSADVKGYYIKGGAESIVRCLLLCRPAKWNKALARLCQQVLTQRDKIVSVRSIGEHEVVSMQTTTGNYVAWGYLSKNCSRYAYIVDWQKRPVLFQPNVAQSIVIDLWAEDEANGYAIQMQQLKARRLGVSTVSELNVCWRFHFHSYSNCVVASADPQKTIEMAGMIRFCHEKQPWWLLPKATKIKHAMPAEFGELHSILSIEAGNQFTGVARGGAPNVVHLSELCLAPNTLIRVDDGDLVPISEVQPGARVITHTGEIATVKRAWRSKRSNELTTEIWPWGAFAPLCTTRDHPVLTDSGWREASSLRDGDYVRHPVRPITKACDSFTYARNSPGQRWQQSHWNVTEPLSREWGYLCGLYLAEGTIQQNARIPKERQSTAVLFSVHADEVELRCRQLAQALGNQHIGVRSKANSKSHVLYVGNAGLARWIASNFGQKDRKHVPDWVWDAGPDFCCGLLEGYLDGDGHYVPDGNEIMASSICVQIIVGMRDVIASLGFGWSAITYKSAGIYYERNCRQQWTLCLAGETAARVRSAFNRPVHRYEPALHWRRVPDGQWIDIQVYRVADGFSETFYDLEIDHEDHSFTTAQCAVHNCEWQDAADLIDGALLPAILDSQDVFLILESTAKGPGWWKNKWEQVKRDWDRGTGKIRPVFLPWYVGTDIYPTPADMRKRPIPEGWVPDDRTVSHAERARQYVLANPMLFKYLAKGDKNWRMPRAQMWWREMGYQSAREEKTLNIFLAEYAGDDFEAFQNSNIPIIDTEVLIGYEERTREPKGVYTIVGPDIPPALVTPRRFWDLDKPPIPIYTRDLVPKLDVKYQLIPLKWQGYAEIDFDLKLFIWEFPDDNHSYGLGVDTSEGIGQDRAVISALRESTPTRGPGQVAEWASAYVTAFQLWPLVMALGCLYSTHSKAAQRRVQCRLAIECWANGAACQHELQKRGWTNFHPWKSYDSRKQRKDGEVNKLGVFTNMTFKALMFDMLLTMLSEEAIDLPSPYLIDELKTLERAGDRRSPQAAPDAYDDRVMGLGFPLFSLHMGKPSWKQHARQRVQYVPGDETEAKPNYAIWRPDQQALDLPNPALMRVARGSLRQQAQILRHVNDRMPKGWR